MVDSISAVATAADPVRIKAGRKKSRRQRRIFKVFRGTTHVVSYTNDIVVLRDEEHLDRRILVTADEVAILVDC